MVTPDSSVAKCFVALPNITLTTCPGAPGESLQCDEAIQSGGGFRLAYHELKQRQWSHVFCRKPSNKIERGLLGRALCNDWYSSVALDMRKMLVCKFPRHIVDHARGD